MRFARLRSLRTSDRGAETDPGSRSSEHSPTSQPPARPPEVLSGREQEPERRAQPGWCQRGSARGPCRRPGQPMKTGTGAPRDHVPAGLDQMTLRPQQIPPGTRRRLKLPGDTRLVARDHSYCHTDGPCCNSPTTAGQNICSHSHTRAEAPSRVDRVAQRNHGSVAVGGGAPLARTFSSSRRYARVRCRIVVRGR
jgi:hypothetical protein